MAGVYITFSWVATRIPELSHNVGTWKVSIFDFCMMGDLIATAWNDALPLIMDDIAYFLEPYDNILGNIEDLV